MPKNPFCCFFKKPKKQKPTVEIIKSEYNAGTLVASPATKNLHEYLESKRASNL